MSIIFKAFLFICAVTSPVFGFDSSAGKLKIEPVVTRLDEPWGVEVLPGGGIVITERGGNLIHVTPDGQRINVKNIPRVLAEGQGGLLDVMVPRDFATTRELFFSYATGRGSNAGTALAVGRLSENGRRLQGTRQIFAMRPTEGGRHFGSRVIEAPDGKLFLTIGDRGVGPQAQNRSNYIGTIVRLNRDGTIPADNPFVNIPNAQPGIWSFGHRNPQGAGLDLQGRLMTAEHGARGGDEVNRIIKGANYGWPVISYGTHYNGRKIGEGVAKAGMQQPSYYWDPSIAPSGLMVYSGKLWPEWKGDIFVGSLKFAYISRLDGFPLREAEQIKSRQTGRVREIVEAPNGTILFLSVKEGALFRISPS